LLSKCSFGISKVEYLSHSISGTGVQTDPKKIEVINQWPQPKFQKDVRSFLGLAQYYKRFIKGYAALSRPLSELITKDGFI